MTTTVVMLSVPRRHQLLLAGIASVGTGDVGKYNRTKNSTGKRTGVTKAREYGFMLPALAKIYLVMTDEFESKLTTSLLYD